MHYSRCFKILLVIAFLFLGLLLTTFYITRKRLRDLFVEKTVEFIERKIKVDVSYRKVYGDVLSGIGFLDLALSSEGMDVKIRNLRVRYSILSFLKKPFIDGIYADKVSIRTKEKKEEKKELKIKGFEPGFSLYVREFLFKDVVINDKVEIQRFKGRISLSEEEGVLTVDTLSGCIFIKKQKINFDRLKGKVVFNKKGFLFESVDLSSSVIKGSLTLYISQDSLYFNTQKLIINSHGFSPDVKGIAVINGNWCYTSKKHKGSLKMSFKKFRFKKYQDIYALVEIKGKGENIDLKARDKMKTVFIKGTLHQYKNLKLDISFNGFENTPYFLVIEKGEVKIKGDIGKRSFNLQGYFTDLQTEKLNVDSMAILAIIEKNKVCIEKWLFTKNKSLLELKGSIGKELNVEIELKRINTKDFERILKIPYQVEMEGKILVQGDMRNPLFNGEITAHSEIFDALSLKMEGFNPVSFEGMCSLWIEKLKSKGVQLDGTLFLEKKRFTFQCITKDKKIIRMEGKVIPEDKKIIFESIGFKPDSGVYFYSKERSVLNLKEGVEIRNFNLYGEYGNLIIKSFLFKDKKLKIFRGYVSNFELSLFKRFIQDINPEGRADMLLDVKDFKGVLQIEIKDFILKNARFKNIYFTIDIDTLSWLRGRVVREKDTSFIKGSVEVDFTKIKLKNFDINLSLNNPGSWVFGFLRKIIVLKKGEIYGNLRIKGSLKEPSLDGKIEIKNGEVFLPAFDLYGTKAYIHLLLAKKKIYLLNSFTDIEKGRLYGNGFFDVHKRNYEFNFSFEDVPISLNGIYMISTGYLDLTGDLNSKPRITGGIEVKEGLIFYEFGKEAPQTSASNLPVISLSIKGERRIWLRNRMMDVELSPDIMIKVEKNKPVIAGDIKVIQGNVYYLEHIFRIKEGVIRFVSQEEINPEIEIVAKTTTDRFFEENGKRKRINIYLYLHGDVKNPIVDFYSEPPVMSEDDILTYLALNLTPEDIYSAEEREVLTRALSGIAVKFAQQQIEKRLKNLMPVDYFVIEPTGEGTRIIVGKYISSKLYVSYAHSFAASEQDAYRVEFETKKNQQIVIEKTEEQRYTIKYEIIWEF